MFTVKVKLYSMLRQQYVKQHSYDSENGINVSIDSPASIVKVCESIGINADEVAFVTINGSMNKALDILLNDGDEVGIHPQPPSGG